MRGDLVELDKRNPVSRVFHAKSDGDTITGWRMDLNRYLHIFNVRLTVHSLQAPLTVHLQTELALQTHVAVSDVRQEVARNHGLVSFIRQGVSSIHELVSDMHRTLVKVQEETDTGNHTVGIHNPLFIIINPYICSRLKPGL